MKKFFAANVFLLFLVSGCATTGVPVQGLPGHFSSEKTGQQENMEKFNLKVAESFAEFRCPKETTFEDVEKDVDFWGIFETAESQMAWVKKIYNLTQAITNGTVYVGQMSKTRKPALYEEDEEVHLLVFSAKEIGEFVFRKKGKFLGCKQISGKRLMGEISGG